MPAPCFEVRLTHAAEDDLEAIRDYLTEHRGADAAEELIDQLLEKIEMLEAFPERGSVPRELEALGISEFRQILAGRFRLIYRVVDQEVFVSVIADGRRDMQALLENRLLTR
jgi:toxin ParE1/3/4